MTTAEILNQVLRPPAPLGEHEFIPCPLAAPIGFKFGVEGDTRTWRVTWCQPLKPDGWLLMIVPEE